MSLVAHLLHRTSPVWLLQIEVTVT